MAGDLNVDHLCKRRPMQERDGKVEGKCLTKEEEIDRQLKNHVNVNSRWQKTL